MIDKSETERAALRHARRFFAEVLTDLGLMPAFWDRTPEEIDRLIEAAIDGYREALQRTAEEAARAQKGLNDPFPF